MKTKTINTDIPHRRISVKISEAAEILGVSQASVRRLIDRGLLKPSRIFRHPLIPVTQLRALLEE